MANIAVLGLGNWGTAIARLWLLEGHKVKGWTIEQEVYESITMNDVNEKYLPHHPVKGLDVSMRLEDALDGSEIVVGAGNVDLNKVSRHEKVCPQRAWSGCGRIAGCCRIGCCPCQ